MSFSSSFLLEFEFDFELSSLLLLELLDSELLADLLFSLLLDLELLSSECELDPDLLSESEPDFLDLDSCVSVLFDSDFFEFLTEDELIFELLASEALLDLVFFDFFEIFEFFFFSSDLTVLDFLLLELLLFLSLIKED